MSTVGLVEECLQDPPQVHKGIATGVWATQRTCYDFILSKVTDGSTTLETGLGVSTVLFARLGCSHTCVVPAQVEIDNVTAYFDERGIEHENVRFVTGFSDEVLPRLKIDPVDLFLIDGAHGYPAPIIDWFYGAQHLRRGGTLVLDDIQLRQVQALDAFLQKDPRWVELSRTDKWVAYRRESEGSLREEHWVQPAFSAPDSLRDQILQTTETALRDAKTVARKVKYRLRRWQGNRRRWPLSRGRP